MGADNISHSSWNYQSDRERMVKIHLVEEDSHLLRVYCYARFGGVCNVISDKMLTHWPIEYSGMKNPNRFFNFLSVAKHPKRMFRLFTLFIGQFEKTRIVFYNWVIEWFSSPVFPESEDKDFNTCLMGLKTFWKFQYYSELWSYEEYWSHMR